MTADKKVYEVWDFSGNEVKGVALENLNAPPLNPTLGRIYFDTVLKKSGVCTSLTPSVVWSYGSSITSYTNSGEFPVTGSQDQIYVDSTAQTFNVWLNGGYESLITSSTFNALQTQVNNIAIPSIAFFSVGTEAELVEKVGIINTTPTYVAGNILFKNDITLTTEQTLNLSGITIDLNGFRLHQNNNKLRIQGQTCLIKNGAFALYESVYNDITHSNGLGIEILGNAIDTSHFMTYGLNVTFENVGFMQYIGIDQDGTPNIKLANGTGSIGTLSLVNCWALSMTGPNHSGGDITNSPLIIEVDNVDGFQLRFSGFKSQYQQSGDYTYSAKINTTSNSKKIYWFSDGTANLVNTNIEQDPLNAAAPGNIARMSMGAASFINERVTSNSLSTAQFLVSVSGEVGLFKTSFTELQQSIISTSITYADLVALRTVSGLITGHYYLLSDYKTTYVQPESGEYLDSFETEPLLIQALGVNKLSTTCKSVLYPQDIVYYDIDDNTEGFTKGKIFRRIDTIQNNDIGTDWRHIKYRRWLLAGDWVWTSGMGYSVGTTVSPTGNIGSPIYACYKSSGSWATLTENFFDTGFTVGEYLSPEVLGLPFSIGNTEHAIVHGVGYIDYFMFDYNSSIINNKITSSFLHNSIFTGSIVKNNEIGDGFNNNTIEGDFTSNKVAKDFTRSMIRPGFEYNTTKGGFYTNIIRTQCKGNVFEDAFNNNFIGSDSSGNVIGNNFIGNRTGNYFYSNNLQGRTSTNLIGDNFTDNNIGTDFNDNTVENACGGNIIGAYATGNTIKTGSSKNTIGADFQDNIVEAGFYGNTVGFGFQNNTLGANFSFNVVGNSVSYNIFDYQAYYLDIKSAFTGKDLTSVLEIYGKTYPHTISNTPNNSAVIQWIDDLGDENIIIV